MILFATSAHGRRTDLPVQFAFALKLKDNKKTKNPGSGEIKRLQISPPSECGLISLFNSYLAFSFFSFF